MARRPRSTGNGKTQNTPIERDITVLNALAARASIAGYLGKSFGGKRDIYEALGYKKDITFDDCYARYRRQDVAKAIVNEPCDESWRNAPTIQESDIDDTDFELELYALMRRTQAFHYLCRLDKLARIGHYAMLLIGFDDGAQPEQPCERASDILYMMPYSEKGAEIEEYESDPTNPRFGLPTLYTIEAQLGGGKTHEMQVHHSRVIHVANERLENDVIGSSALEGVFNRLQDLELVAGSSAEMFWRGAFPGYTFDAKEGFEVEDATAMTDEIEGYLHGLKRYMRLAGIEANALQLQVASPKDHAEMLLDLIAAGSRFPKRILMGSERGELASSQDQNAWLSRIMARNITHCEPAILRPFIDHAIEKGIVTEPEDYSIDWPDLLAPTLKDKVDIGKTRAESIRDYTGAMGAETLIPPEVFLRELLGFTSEQAERIMQVAIDQPLDDDPEDKEE